MKIGKMTLELLKEPERIEEQLLAMTGSLVAEVREHLTHNPIASHVAAALIPFVKEAPARVYLAEEIAAEGVDKVRREVLKLYDDLLGIKPPPMPEHLKPKGTKGGA